MTKKEKWERIYESEDVDAEMRENIKDGNWEEVEEETEESSSLPPKLGFDDVSFKDLEELDD